jgi:hypothetical protein
MSVARNALCTAAHHAILLPAHASWLVAKSRSDFALPLCVRKGLQRKARFLARSAKNAPEFRIGIKLQMGFGKDSYA